MIRFASSFILRSLYSGTVYARTPQFIASSISRCISLLFLTFSCSSSFRMTVPINVPSNVRDSAIISTASSAALSTPINPTSLSPIFIGASTTLFIFCIKSRLYMKASDSFISLISEITMQSPFSSVSVQ